MQKEKSLEVVTKDMIHRLRTPLVVIKSGVETMKSYMPTLIKAYELAKKNGFDLEEIPMKNLKMLEKLLENTEQEAHSINDYINTLVKYLESNY